MTVVDEVIRREHGEHVECGGARVLVQSLGVSGVITVTGDIDSSNADCVAGVLNNFSAGKDPVTVDVSGVDLIGAQGIRALLDFDDRCRRAGVEWVLVTSPMVHSLLQRIDGVGAPRALPRVAREKLRC